VGEVEVAGFAIELAPVTVAEFARFAEQTGYVTLAERPPGPADYPDANPALLVAGSAVFHRTPGPVALDRFESLVGICAGRRLAPSVGTPQR
jgi:formylglycine-generating enzyme